jgi:hypothetical protein
VLVAWAAHHRVMRSHLRGLVVLIPLLVAALVALLG